MAKRINEHERRRRIGEIREAITILGCLDAVNHSFYTVTARGVDGSAVVVGITPIETWASVSRYPTWREMVSDDLVWHHDCHTSEQVVDRVITLLAGGTP
jgi:hypothetical protein